MSFRKIRTCFVTGGTGFIGSHLVDLLLENGCEVRCLVRNRGKLGWLLGKPVTVFEGDLGSHGVLRSGASGVDAVFHLAGLTAAASREQYRLVNAGGCGNLARASLEADEPPGVFVYVSSLAAVGPSYNDTAVEESRAPHPVTEYGRSKLEGERVLAGMGPLPLVVVRPPAVYGPRDREILPLFRLAARGFLPIFNPAARLSMVHVRDLVKGILASAEGGRAGETYFLAHPQAVRARELPALMEGAIGRKVRGLPAPPAVLGAAAAASEAWGRMRGNTPLFNRDKVRELTAAGWVCSTRKAAKDFGFEAGIGHHEGLGETAEWYRGQGWM